MKLVSKAYDFLTKERCAVLSLLVAKDTVHSAAMLYSYQVDPLELYFFTESDSRKMAYLGQKQTLNCSLVVGTTEEKKKTLQMNGEILFVTDESYLKKIKHVHYARFPKSIPYESPKTVFLKFVPRWYRFTDYTFRPPEISEED